VDDTSIIIINGAVSCFMMRARLQMQANIANSDWYTKSGRTGAVLTVMYPVRLIIAHARHVPPDRARIQLHPDHVMPGDVQTREYAQRSANGRKTLVQLQ
jgi:arylamine N-acetyltransferase